MPKRFSSEDLYAMDGKFLSILDEVFKAEAPLNAEKVESLRASALEIFGAVDDEKIILSSWVGGRFEVQGSYIGARLHLNLIQYLARKARGIYEKCRRQKNDSDLLLMYTQQWTLYRENAGILGRVCDFLQTCWMRPELLPEDLRKEACSFEGRQVALGNWKLRLLRPMEGAVSRAVIRLVARKRNGEITEERAAAQSDEMISTAIQSFIEVGFKNEEDMMGLEDHEKEALRALLGTETAGAAETSDAVENPDEGKEADGAQEPVGAQEV